MKRSDGRVGQARSLAAVILACGLASAWADAEPSRYTSIVDRNPFGLKPPPDPATLTPPTPPPTPAPLATVELTGITSILGNTRALLEIIPGPGKQMIKPILSEGEKVESVEVVSIDIEKNQVVIKNGALVTNLTFKVARASSGPGAPGPAGGLPGVVPGVVPSTIPGGVPQPTINYSQPPAGRSGVIMTGGTPSYQPAAAGAVGQTGMQPVPPVVNPATSPFRSIPSRNIRSGLPQTQQAPATLSPEAAVIDIEHKRQLNPSLPYPPTPLTPRLQMPPVPGQGGQQ